MAAQPLCPLVLSKLEARPHAAHEVARELARADPARRHHAAVLQTLERLVAAELVTRRGGAGYRLTRRGRAELALQRLLWRRAAAAARRA
jgi:DNA-binding PadR family transcriptional regulator